MKKLSTYLISGILFLAPIFLLYQALVLVASVITPFIDLPLPLAFLTGLVVVIALGWIVIHIFKRHVKRYLRKHAAQDSWFGILASGILEFDTASERTKKAFHNPILYKVDDGIYKLGFITNDDIASFEQPLADSNANPMPGAVWVYAPYPVNFFGEMVLVERQNIRPIAHSEKKNLPLFILSGGIINKK